MSQLPSRFVGEVLAALNESHVSGITLHYETQIRLVIMFFSDTKSLINLAAA